MPETIIPDPDISGVTQIRNRGVHYVYRNL